MSTASQYSDALQRLGEPFGRTSARSGITAVASGTISTAFQLDAMNNEVTTVASAGDAIKLPSAVPGMRVAVYNNQATNAMNVFPYSASESINVLSGGTAYSQAAAKCVEYYCAAAGKWFANLSA